MDKYIIELWIVLMILLIGYAIYHFNHDNKNRSEELKSKYENIKWRYLNQSEIISEYGTLLIHQKSSDTNHICSLYQIEYQDGTIQNKIKIEQMVSGLFIKHNYLHEVFNNTKKGNTHENKE